MATIDAVGAMSGVLGNALQELLMADCIVPGEKAGYQLAKTIYELHPHGAKLADSPVAMAQFKARAITVRKTPGDGEMFVKAFIDEWKAVQADRLIFNVGRLARVYGVSTLGLLEKDAVTTDALDFKSIDKAIIGFNVWDPLNTAGSLVLNQDPNSLDFQKPNGVSVNGVAYHRSRVCVLMNEAPLYISYQPSAFGFSGRSIYQRGLFPLKSFILTMATDAMIAVKAGVLIAKVKSQSSAVDGPMAWLMGQRREMVKEAETNNVLSIDIEEDIESMNLQNLEGPYTLARKNIIENEAAACGTPAKIVLAETFAEGFGEGTEDAKAIAQFVDSIRAWLDPVYSFMDEIVMYRAWNQEFYASVQDAYPDRYADVPYNVAFNEWRNSFTAEWPNLLEEPDSEKAKAEDVALRAIIAVVEVLLPVLPPEEKARVIQFMMDNINERKRLFSSPLVLDIEAIAAYEPPAPQIGQEPPEPRPEGMRNDSDTRERLDGIDDEVRRTAIAGLRIVQGKAVGDGAAI